jgi:hydrogenase maturation protease
MSNRQMTEDEGRTMVDAGYSSLALRRPSILVVGMGNPILGDDGVGWRVAEEVQRRLQSPVSSDQRLEIEVDCVSLGGLSLMERLIGYDRVVLIDAIATGRQPVGTVTRFPLADLPDVSAGHSTSAHDTSLKTALQLGGTLGAAVPTDITVVAVETRNTFDFSEELTPAVAAAVPRAADMVMRALGISHEE